MTPQPADLKAIFGLPPTAAIDYLKRKGFQITWDWHEVDAATHARAFTVAKAARLDILQDIRNGLTDNLAQGGTLRDFERQMQPLLEKKGWWGTQQTEDGETVRLGSPRRLRTIYQTNLQAAHMAGRTMAALQSTETHPYWMYIAVLDGGTRPTHRALHGKVFRWDDPIWQHILPPNGYGCRCRFIALTEAEVKRRGLSVDSSRGQTGQITVETGVDQRTGEVRSQTITTLNTTDQAGKPITFRPDAGFDGSPMQSHLMDGWLLQKARQTLGEVSGLAEMQQILLHPTRQRAWEGFVDTALAPGPAPVLDRVTGELKAVAQHQSMAFGVIRAPELAFARAKGVEIQSGLLFLEDNKLVGPKAARHVTAGNALSTQEWKTLPQLLAQADQVLWDGDNRTLLYVVPSQQQQALKIAVRFNRAQYGGQSVDDVATAFKVASGNIEEGIVSGRYERIR